MSGNLYMPAEIVVGMFDSEYAPRSGFVTYKYMDKGWQQASVFERLCGFKPSNQKDAEIQLKKAVSASVERFPNEPVEGFTVTGKTGNIYGSARYSGEYGSMLIRDPRGFVFGIDPADFAEIVSKSSISDGVLVGKWAYSRRKDEEGCVRLVLLKEGTPEFKNAEGVRICYENRPSAGIRGVARRDMVVGRAYRLAKIPDWMREDGRDWVYAGVMDTYSSKCHMEAFDAGSYKGIPERLSTDEAQVRSSRHSRYSCCYSRTTKNHMVFVPARYGGNCSDGMIARTSVSGLFSAPSPGVKYYTFAGEKGMFPPTAESVAAAVSRSLAFQRIDFARYERENRPVEPLLIENFIALYISRKDKSPENSLFPFDPYGTSPLLCEPDAGRIQDSERIFDIGRPVWKKIVCESRIDPEATPLVHSALEWRIYRLDPMRPATEVRYKASLKNIYQMLAPTAPVIYFENGQKVRQLNAIKFVPADIRSAASRLW